MHHKHIVSYDEWFTQNYEQLTHLYNTLQEACLLSGRCIFDRETCDFNKFCNIAYKNSYKYKKHDENYDQNEEEDEENITF
tara:strand:+ start:483 stop:725 length:243 start_codon:yes stop_codon:yes gene_type:complete